MTIIVLHSTREFVDDEVIGTNLSTTRFHCSRMDKIFGRLLSESLAWFCFPGEGSGFPPKSPIQRRYRTITLYGATTIIYPRSAIPSRSEAIPLCCLSLVCRTSFVFSWCCTSVSALSWWRVSCAQIFGIVIIYSRWITIVSQSDSVCTFGPG